MLSIDVKAFISTSRYHYIIDLHVYSIFEVSVTSITLEACHCPLQQTHQNYQPYDTHAYQ